MREGRYETGIHAEEYQAAVRSMCGRISIVPRSGESLVRGYAALFPRGRVAVACFHNDVAEISRDCDDVRADGGEHVFLILQEAGEALMRQDERSRRLTPGSFILIDDARPFQFRYLSPRSKQLSVHMSRRELVGAFREEDLRGTGIDRSDALAGALRSVLSRLLEKRTAGDVDLANEAFFDLLKMQLRSIVNGGEQTCANVPEVFLARAKEIIRHKFRDPDCSPAAIARDMNVPLRTLQRAFQAEGETPARCLINMRLEHARYQIGLRGCGLMRGEISQIAYEAGFNDLSYFNRSFRARFNHAPSDVPRIGVLSHSSKMSDAKVQDHPH